MTQEIEKERIELLKKIIENPNLEGAWALTSDDFKFLLQEENLNQILEDQHIWKQEHGDLRQKSMSNITTFNTMFLTETSPKEKNADDVDEMISQVFRSAKNLSVEAKQIYVMNIMDESKLFYRTSNHWICVVAVKNGNTNLYIELYDPSGRLNNYTLANTKNYLIQRGYFSQIKFFSSWLRKTAIDSTRDGFVQLLDFFLKLQVFHVLAILNNDFRHLNESVDGYMRNNFRKWKIFQYHIWPFYVHNKIRRNPDEVNYLDFVSAKATKDHEITNYYPEKQICIGCNRKSVVFWEEEYRSFNEIEQIYYVLERLKFSHTNVMAASCYISKKLTSKTSHSATDSDLETLKKYLMQGHYHASKVLWILAKTMTENQFKHTKRPCCAGCYLNNLVSGIRFWNEEMYDKNEEFFYVNEMFKLNNKKWRELTSKLINGKYFVSFVIHVTSR